MIDKERVERMTKVALTMPDADRDAWKRDIAHDHGTDSMEFRIVRDAVANARERERQKATR